MTWVIVAILVIAVLILIRSITIIRQAQKGLVERFGRYKETLDPGLKFLMPFVDSLRSRVDMRETVIDVEPQPVITKDKINTFIKP